MRTARDQKVDFLARYPDGTQKLIQVCVDLDTSEIINREVRSLQAAARDYPLASLHLVIGTPVSSSDLPQEIALHTAATWLLNDSE